MGALIGFPHSHQLFNRNCLPPRMGLCHLWNWLATPHLRNESTKIQNGKTGLTGHMGAILSGSLVMTLATPLSQGSSLWVRVEVDGATQPDWGLQLLLLPFDHALLHRLSVECPHSELTDSSSWTSSLLESISSLHHSPVLIY